jgi:hypothetical protein
LMKPPPKGALLLGKPLKGLKLTFGIACDYSVSDLRWSRMYARIVSSSRPTVLTQYPVAQKLKPVIRLTPSSSLWIRIALFPLIYPTVFETLYFGGILKHKWIWSGIACPSSNSIPFWRHRSRMIGPIFFLNCPYIVSCRYFDTNTMWYLQSHLTCDSDFHSLIGSSSYSLRGFPWGRTYYHILVSPDRSEPLRVARAEPEV